MYGTAPATIRGYSTTPWSRNELALRANRRSNMLQRLLLPQDHHQPTPLFAGAKPYPRAAQNGPLRRESVAEAAIQVPGPRNAFLQKSCICAE